MTTERVPDIDSLAHATARAERLRALAREVARTATGHSGLCDPIEAAWLNEHRRVGQASARAPWFNSARRLNSS
jgi:hypothetical protein